MMGSLVYLMITSADGYTADADGNFDWAVPTPALHAHAERFTRGLSGQIYGPRMWETMRVWRDIRPGDGQAAVRSDSRNIVNEFEPQGRPPQRPVASQCQLRRGELNFRKRDGSAAACIPP